VKDGGALTGVTISAKGATPDVFTPPWFGFRVSGFGFRVSVLGFEGESGGLRVEGRWFGVEGLGFKVEIEVWGLGFGGRL